MRVRQYTARLRCAAGGPAAATVSPAEPGSADIPAIPGPVRPGTAGPGRAGPGRAGQGRAGFLGVQGRADTPEVQGTAGPGTAGPGTAGPGRAGVPGALRTAVTPAADTGAVTGAGAVVRAGGPRTGGLGTHAGAAAEAVTRAAARLVLAYGDVRQRARRLMSPLLVDACLAAALFTAMCVVLRAPLAQRPVVMPLLHAGLSWPLAVRRRAPLVAFACMAATALAQWAADIRTPADVTLLLALYAVAAAHDRVRTLAAFAMLEVGILLATLRWSDGRDSTGTFVSLSAMAIAATVIGSNVRGRRERMAVLEDRAVRLERERDQRAQLAVAGERTRIAREMHDIVTHNLSVMVALADGALFAQEAAPDRAAAAMRQVGTTGRQAITDMRRFLGVLRADEPDALRHPMPGIGRLGSLAEQVRAAGLPTRLAVAGDPALVPAAAQLTVYRMVQEALTNTLKHAPAGTRAEVDVRCSAEAVAVTVTDDGAGAVPREPAPASGHGLSGMRERAAAYGGRLSAGPLPGGGWQVAAELVLTPTEDL